MVISLIINLFVLIHTNFFFLVEKSTLFFIKPIKAKSFADNSDTKTNIWLKFGTYTMFYSADKQKTLI